MTSPPTPQPKQWYSLPTGSTEKLGVRSSWNGHRPTKRAPETRRSDVRSETTSTMSAAAFTASTESSLIRAIGRPYVRPSAYESANRSVMPAR